MPVARIITDLPEESLELAMQLQARGYQVETVSLNHAPDTPADLVVRLDECAMEDVMARMAAVSEKDGSVVFVAPGALEEIRSTPLPGTWFREDWAAENAYPCRRAVETKATRDHEPDAADADTRRRQYESIPTVAAESLSAALTIADVPAAQPPEEVEPELQRVAAGQIEEAAPLLDRVSIREVGPSIQVPTDDARVKAEVPSLAPVPHQAAEQAPERPRLRAGSREAIFWRTAILAATLATAVVVIGSVWQQKRPAPAVLPSPSKTQQIPFQGAQRAIAPPNAQPSSPVSSAIPTAAKAQPPTPVAASPASELPAPRANPPITTARKESKAISNGPRKELPKPTRKPAPARGAGMIAEDTVTYFGQRAHTGSVAPSQNNSNSGSVTQ